MHATAGQKISACIHHANLQWHDRPSVCSHGSLDNSAWGSFQGATLKVWFYNCLYLSLPCREHATHCSHCSLTLVYKYQVVHVNRSCLNNWKDRHFISFVGYSQSTCNELKQEESSWQWSTFTSFIGFIIWWWSSFALLYLSITEFMLFGETGHFVLALLGSIRKFSRAYLVSSVASKLITQSMQSDNIQDIKLWCI